MDYQEYEEEVKKIEKKNEKYLKEFEKSMIEKKLSNRTIRKHLSNVDFYINDYLNHYDPTEMEEGCYHLDGFLGDFFIRKCMWSTGNATKETASSIKKFYKCMYELGHIEKDAYDYLCEEIKDSLDEWVDKVERYNDLDEEFDFFDFI